MWWWWKTAEEETLQLFTFQAIQNKIGRERRIQTHVYSGLFTVFLSEIHDLIH